MKRMRRILSLLLAVAMVAGMFPMLAPQTDAASVQDQIFDYLTGTMKLNNAAACGVHTGQSEPGRRKAGTYLD